MPLAEKSCEFLLSMFMLKSKLSFSDVIFARGLFEFNVGDLFVRNFEFTNFAVSIDVNGSMCHYLVT